MATAGSIVVDLTMRTGMFETDSKRAEKRLLEFEKQAKQFGAAVGVAIASAATALAVLVKGSIDSADALGKLSQSTGTSVEELSALTYAADLSGVSQDQLGTSLVKLTKNMSDAAKGTGEAKDAFAALGIEVKGADGKLKSSTQVLGEVATKFASYEDGAEKTALAVALFGKSGADLIPLLNAGATGISEMEAEARKLGVTFDGQAAKSAEQFNDNVSRLSATGKGLVNRIAQELLPSLASMTDKLVNSAKGAELLDKVARVAATGVKLLASVGAIVAGIFNAVGSALGGVAATVVQFFSGDFAAAFDTAKATTSDFVGNLKGTADAVAGIWDDSASAVAAGADDTANKLAAPAIEAEKKVKKAGKSIEDEAKRIYENVEKQIGAINRDIAVFGQTDEQKQMFDLKAAGATPEQLTRASAGLDRLRVLKDEADVQEKLEEIEKRRRENSAQVLSDLNLEIEALGKTTEWIAKRNALLDAGVTAESATGQEISKTVDLLYERGRVIDDQVSSMDAFRDASRDFLGDLWEGKSVWDSLTDAVDNFADALFDIASKRLIEQVLGQAGTTETGSAGGWMSAIASIFGGAKAVGGDTIAGRSYLVGEQGPEMFVPRTAGTVIPADQTAAAMGAGRGGMNVTQIINSPNFTDPRSKSQILQQSAMELRVASGRNG